jgi:hypothetical protein
MLRCYSFAVTVVAVLTDEALPHVGALQAVGRKTGEGTSVKTAKEWNAEQLAYFAYTDALYEQYTLDGRFRNLGTLVPRLSLVEMETLKDHILSARFLWLWQDELDTLLRTSSSDESH